MAKWLILFTKGRGEKETFGGRERLKKIILVVLLGGAGILVASFLLKHEIPLVPIKQQSPSVESLLGTLLLDPIEQRRLFSFGDELYRKGHYEQTRVYYLKILSAVERKRKELVKEPEKTLQKLVKTFRIERNCESIWVKFPLGLVGVSLTPMQSKNDGKRLSELFGN